MTHFTNDRLAYIMMTNREYGMKIVEFIELNPLFKKYMGIVALDSKMVMPASIKTVKDTLLYYVSFAGVRADYGAKVWKYVRNSQYDKLTEKKRTVVMEILKLPEITTTEQFNSLPKIKGIGEGAISFVNQHFFHLADVTYPTDRTFQSGLEKIYSLDKMTVTQAKRIINEWKGSKSIGNMFCFQVANYA